MDLKLEIRAKLDQVPLPERLKKDVVERIANELSVDIRDVLMADVVVYSEALKSHKCPKWICDLPKELRTEIVETAGVLEIIFPVTPVELGLETESTILEVDEVKALLDKVQDDPLEFAKASEEYRLSEQVVRKVAERTGKTMLEIFLLSPELYSDALMELDVGEKFYSSFRGSYDITWIEKLGLSMKEQKTIHIASEARQIIEGVIPLERASYDHSSNMEVLLSHFDYGLEAASDDIKSNPESVLRLVREHGTYQLKWAADEVKRNPDVLKAVAEMPEFDIGELESDEELYKALQQIVKEQEKPHTADSIGSGVNPTLQAVAQFTQAAIGEKTVDKVANKDPQAKIGRE